MPPGGLREALLPGERSLPAYRLEVSYPAGRHPSSSATRTRFPPTLGELDLHLFGEGTHHRLWRRARRARPRRSTASPAPPSPSGRRTRARSASSATSTAGTAGSTRCARSASSGIWELFVPDLGRGHALQVRDPRRRRRRSRLKADPIALRAELPPQTAVGRLRLAATTGATRDWMERARGAEPLARPMAIYEVHLGSWRLEHARGQPLADLRRARPTSSPSTCSSLGFTHVELLPVSEHPFDGLVGLSGDRLLRADRRASARPTISATSSTRCTRAASA